MKSTIQKFKTTSEIRLENAKKLASKFENFAAFSRFLKKDNGFMHKIFSENYKSKNIGDDLAREIENKFDLPYGWLDNIHPENIPLTLPIYTINDVVNKLNAISKIQVGDIVTTDNIFGIMIDKAHSSSLYQDGAIIIFTENLDHLEDGDLILVNINGKSYLRFYYCKNNVTKLLNLNMSEDIREIDNSSIIGRALKSINPTGIKNH